MERPNGIAFSPDEKTLYVANSHPPRPIWMAYPGQGRRHARRRPRVFQRAALVGAKARKGMPDGMKVDQHGNLFAAGPGGVVIFTPEGKQLGMLATGEPTANCAFGEDGSTLFIAANHHVLRIRLSTKGIGF